MKRPAGTASKGGSKQVKQRPAMHPGREQQTMNEADAHRVGGKGDGTTLTVVGSVGMDTGLRHFMGLLVMS